MQDLSSKISQFFLGKGKNLRDPHLFHALSLTPLLAWVGLGADGLSSSAYGPAESYANLQGHEYLGLPLSILMAITVILISAGYSLIIRKFPAGGGGYVVASRLIGEKVGVISGSALIVDYVLTITTSVAGGVDAVFSFLPPHWQTHKLGVAVVVIGILILLNIRGVKESVTIVVPIFAVFVLCHLVGIVGGVIMAHDHIPAVMVKVKTDFAHDLKNLGWVWLLGAFLKAYSLGGSSYTGIEAVSNGLVIMREPREKTGRRTMLYMAASLAFCLFGLTLCYLLYHVLPVKDKTLNAVLFEGIFGNWTVGGYPLGQKVALLTVVSEALLLAVAAQAGFIDGPRVMANMANDSWLPRRLGSLSERLTMQAGVMMMGVAAIAALLYTQGKIGKLLVMYSINVFVTFTLSQLGMALYWVKERKKEPDWKKCFSINAVGTVLCLTVLIITLRIKFEEGGWITVAVTTILVALCYLIRRNYHKVSGMTRDLDKMMELLRAEPARSTLPLPPLETNARTAVIMVRGFSGVGVHTLLHILQWRFNGLFKQVVFVSAGVVHSNNFGSPEMLDAIETDLKKELEKYVTLARRLGVPADYRYAVGTNPLDLLTEQCIEVSQEYPQSTYFAGSLVFARDTWINRLLHNSTAGALQRTLTLNGLFFISMPIKVSDARALIAEESLSSGLSSEPVAQTA